MNNFGIRKNGTKITQFDCAGSIIDLPIEKYTDELIVLQTLRTIYYMSPETVGKLPWTSKDIYNWLKSKISGINIVDGLCGGNCCNSYDDGFYINIGTEDEFNRDFDRYWPGISGNIVFYMHEARHIDGYPHVSCCGITGGCDQVYDESDLGAYGIQWWLNWAWVEGKIDIGLNNYSADHQKRLKECLADTCNIFRERFCDNKPPLITNYADELGCPGPDNYLQNYWEK